MIEEDLKTIVKEQMRNNGETEVDQSTLDQEKFVKEEKGHLQKKMDIDEESEGKTWRK